MTFLEPFAYLTIGVTAVGGAGQLLAPFFARVPGRYNVARLALLVTWAFLVLVAAMYSYCEHNCSAPALTGLWVWVIAMNIACLWVTFRVIPSRARMP